MSPEIIEKVSEINYIILFFSILLGILILLLIGIQISERRQFIFEKLNFAFKKNTSKPKNKVKSKLKVIKGGKRR